MTTHARRLDVDEQLRLLMRGVEYGDESVRASMESELRARLAEGSQLRVYAGFDPRTPDLHLGHTIPLRKLRQFQELGHHAIFVIGTYTALIGDPSDKDQARSTMTPEETEANARAFTEQAFRVLDPERTEVRRNGEWLSKLGFAEIVHLTSRFTVAQFLERETFQKRFRGNQPIYLHELLYAIMQGYDAVALRADVQIGATEQLFNLMAGRDLQRAFGQRPQVAVTLPVLTGTDGVLRMSKSTGNHIPLNDPPDQMYGKIMSIPDTLIVEYSTLLTDLPMEEVEEMRRALETRSENPMTLKKRIARAIVAGLHGDAPALEAEEAFTRTFQRRELPTDVPEFELSGDPQQSDLLDILKNAGLVGSKSEGRRLLGQGAIEVDGRPVFEPIVSLPNGSLIRVGKHRFLRIIARGR